MSDLEGPLEQLEQGLQLVIDRTGARWQKTGRTHLFFEVPKDRAKRIFEALGDRFEVRRKSGPSGQARILTPEPVPEADVSEEDWTYLVDGHLGLYQLAERLDMAREGLDSAVQRGEFNTVLKRGHGPTGRQGEIACAVADEDLARYLAKRGDEGWLRTPDGRVLEISQHRPMVEFKEPWYSHRQLADLLECHKNTVSGYLRDEQLPWRRGYYGRHEYAAGPELADALERLFTVNVRIAAGLSREAEEVMA